MPAHLGGTPRGDHTDWRLAAQATALIGEYLLEFSCNRLKTPIQLVCINGHFITVYAKHFMR
jgi:hypothetical protein